MFAYLYEYLMATRAAHVSLCNDISKLFLTASVGAESHRSIQRPLFSNIPIFYDTIQIHDEIDSAWCKKWRYHRDFRTNTFISEDRWSLGETLIMLFQSGSYRVGHPQESPRHGRVDPPSLFLLTQHWLRDWIQLMDVPHSSERAKPTWQAFSFDWYPYLHSANESDEAPCHASSTIAKLVQVFIPWHILEEEIGTWI